MSRLTESAIENFAIKLFEKLGYSYAYGRVHRLCSASGTPAGYITRAAIRKFRTVQFINSSRRNFHE